MPVYTVGRGYTKRHHAKADTADPEAVRTVMEEMAAAGPFGVEGRLADAEQRAIAYLQGKDPSAPLYGDPAWRRENERKSLDWYAIEILNTIRILRRQIERGDARLAADLALDLGVLATEAKMIQYIAGNTNRGGQGFKTSDKYQEVAAQHAAWRAQADELWKKKPRYGALAIAKLIDPARAETIRKVIVSRKP
jgi:hypothetical protein